MKMLNFNCFLENLPSMDELNFTNFVSERVIGGTSYCCCSYCYFCKFTFAKLLILVIAASPEGASYCCFRKAASNNFFHKVLLTNFISTYVNLLQHFIFAQSLLIEGYGKCALLKEPVIAPFV